jgi:hypothetical protein
MKFSNQPGPRGSEGQDSLTAKPSLEVQLRKELHELLKPTLEGPHDRAVALSGRPLSEVFARSVPLTPISLEEARGSTCISIGGYNAWPIFVTPGYRNTFAAVFNRADLEKTFPDYFPAAASTIRGGIGEAVRNIGQHGYRDDARMLGLWDGEALFTSAALLVKEIEVTNPRGDPHRLLVAVVADEGRGMRDPQWSLLDGAGEGEDHEGMGVELKASLIYLVKASSGEWSLFDGLSASVPSKYVSPESFHDREIGRDERVPRVSAVDLPAPRQGCQKIAVYAHPKTSPEDAKEIVSLLIGALSARE